MVIDDVCPLKQGFQHRATARTMKVWSGEPIEACLDVGGSERRPSCHVTPRRRCKVYRRRSSETCLKPGDLARENGMWRALSQTINWERD
jgi:hypothetical protein